MLKKLIYLTLIFAAFGLQAQDYARYEVSETHPFGQPNPEAPEQVKDFTPMIGKCKCRSESRNSDGTWAQPQEMIWTFKYIMNGMGVQDETLKADGGNSGSIRQYIADSTRWYVHYYSSVGPTTVLSAWEGNLTEEKDKIILYRDQTAPNGMEGFYRITFYDFSEEGYKWVGEWTDKSEKITYPTWKISCTKSSG